MNSTSEYLALLPLPGFRDTLQFLSQFITAGFFQRGQKNNPVLRNHRQFFPDPGPARSHRPADKTQAYRAAADRLHQAHLPLQLHLQAGLRTGRPARRNRPAAVRSQTISKSAKRKSPGSSQKVKLSTKRSLCPKTVQIPTSCGTSQQKENP